MFKADIATTTITANECLRSRYSDFLEKGFADLPYLRVGDYFGDVSGNKQLVLPYDLDIERRRGVFVNILNV